ncbi:hypothetical protein SEA_THIMANN_29 [Gordonia phage Thimann]|uniref:Minor tail protein n=1 Tax=Gordonia phage Suerte TaxID=2652883 RepID=A0A5P8DFR2_9CAUD|nr:head protein [Gordonia phage Suerte]QFP97000.1 hypothetical protein SEA_SUERTE_27 [Gordonia phage Suerte]WNM74292.1 hypothetical protein SEA_THIMANN_29 [Gordonia phage Thimann]
MALATDAMKTVMLNAYKAEATWLSLHTADPGSTGASEVSGGTPAYARKQTTWGTPASGSMIGSKVSIDVPATTVVAVGVWTASTAGSYRDKLAIPSTTVSANATIDVTPTITIT